MFQNLVGFLGFIILLSCLTVAEKGQAAEAHDELRQIMRLTNTKVKVTQVINGDTFVINNTETIHLPAIYIPSESGRGAGEYEQEAKKFLEETILNKFVAIYQIRNQNRGQENALGHTEGYVVREDGLFVQAEMVEQGLAFAYPTESHYDVADKLYESEEKARDNKAGVWDSPQWAILDEEGAKNAPMDRFAIVEGIVERVASRNNVIYLNFDRDWRDDFTISVDSSRRRDFAKDGHNLMQMGGQAVRVRGWVREYNGPFIEAFHSSQLELLDEITTTQELETIEAGATAAEDTNAEDTIKERVQPNSAMFPNPTLQQLGGDETE